MTTKQLKFLKGLTATKQRELLQRLKVEWTYTSNALEGNTISLGDTQFIIQYGLTIKGKSIQEHIEVIGHARAVDLVYELLEKDILEKQDIFNLLIYIEYSKPENIEHLIQLWLKDFNAQNELINEQQAIHAYTKLHLAFTSIHPFFDGNGRMARLLANIPLLKNGFLPIVVNNKNREDYLEALSKYDLSAPKLNQKTTQLVIENSAFENLKSFFEQQYENTKNLVDEIT
jgi:Fic family protein